MRCPCTSIASVRATWALEYALLAPSEASTWPADASRSKRRGRCTQDPCRCARADRQPQDLERAAGIERWERGGAHRTAWQTCRVGPSRSPAASVTSELNEAEIASRSLQRTGASVLFPSAAPGLDLNLAGPPSIFPPLRYAADPPAGAPPVIMTQDDDGTATGTGLDDLPEDMVVSKILVLLPPKDVGRCHAIRKSWRSATSTPEFMLEHHRHQPSQPIIVGAGGQLDALLDSVDSIAHQPIWPFLSWVSLHATCHGFLVVSQPQLGSGFYICNPAIRQIASLPQPEFRPNNAILSLYQHNETGEYRVLWSSLVEVDSGKNETTLYILKVGDSNSRNIGGLSAVSPPSLQQALLEALPRGPYTAYNPPVHHRGHLHWMCMCRTVDIVVVFDTGTESFRSMRNATDLGSLDELFDLKGKLALCSLDNCLTYMDLWVMEDYAAEIWDLKYRIDVSSIHASQTLNLTSLNKENIRKMMMGTHVAPTTNFLSDLVMVNERQLLVGFSNKHVLHCNIGGSSLGTKNIKGRYYMELTPYRFKQSILPIPSSEMQQENNNVNGHFQDQEHAGNPLAASSHAEV